MKNLNENAFISAITVLTVGVISYLLLIDSVNKSSVIGMLGGLGFNLSLFLITVFGLQYYQLGTGRDIPKEIFDEGNVAASIYEGLLFVAIAIVLGKGL